MTHFPETRGAWQRFKSNLAALLAITLVRLAFWLDPGTLTFVVQSVLRAEAEQLAKEYLTP